MNRIVHIITGLSTGGAEMMLLRLVEHLRGEFEQHVVSLTGRGNIASKIEALRVPVLALGLRGTWPNPLAVVRLARHISRLRPTVAQTWMYHADLFGGLSARMAGVPKVVWNLRATNLGTEKPFTRIIQRQINARIARWLPNIIVCCGESVRLVHLAAGYPAIKLRVIPNGVDTARFMRNSEACAALRRALGIPESAPVIGRVGRLHAMKDYGTFFAAAKCVIKVLPQARFVLAGAGLSPGEVSVTRWIHETGLAGKVHLLGEWDDVPALYNALNVFVSSSESSEGFPNVLIEAMACGLPCVATDVGESAAIVGKTGRVVPPRSPEALADAVIELLQLPVAQRMKLGEEARKRVCEEFSIEGIGKQYANLYRSLCSDQ